MTGDPLTDLLISIGGIIVMVLIARLVFPSPSIKVTQDVALDRISFEEPDFKPVSWLIDDAGRAAIVEGAGGEFILVERLGLDVLLRRFQAGVAKASEVDHALVVKLPDVTLPKAVITNVDASQWVKKITCDRTG